MGPHAEYTLIDPFWIDDGELAGLTLVQAFTLGVEWTLVRERIETGEDFVQAVHTANATRILRLSGLRTRHAEVVLDEDHPEWSTLRVGDPDEGGGTLLGRRDECPRHRPVGAARGESISVDHGGAL